jgi:hypothetical protein
MFSSRVSKGLIWEDQYNMIPIRLIPIVTQKVMRDLAECWQTQTREFVASIPDFPFTLRLAATKLPFLKLYASERYTIRDISPDGTHLLIDVLFSSLEEARMLVLAEAHANGVHSWQVRAAYHLQSACDFLTLAAIQLLAHGDESYIREKLQSGLRRITEALYEEIRESDTPAMFNFKATYFPDEHTF